VAVPSEKICPHQLADRSHNRSATDAEIGGHPVDAWVASAGLPVEPIEKKRADGSCVRCKARHVTQNLQREKSI
jgi:hypothetical protein